MARSRNACGAPTKMCLCGHDGFEHRFGNCLFCDCKLFEARPCNLGRVCVHHGIPPGTPTQGDEHYRLARLGLPVSQPDVRDCGVYFIKCGDFVKIGHSHFIPQRIAAISANLPFDVELIATIPCSPAVASATERGLHRCFEQQLHRGEWFRLESPLVEFIDSLTPSETLHDAARSQADAALGC